MDNTAILGEMKIVPIGGSLVVLFRDLSQRVHINIRRFHNDKEIAVEIKNDPYIGYTHGALFGIGRNPIVTKLLHPDDQEKLCEAKNAMIEWYRAEARSKQQVLIDTIGATGFVTPRP